MKSFPCTIRDKEGLHARPAVKLIKLVGTLASSVTIEKAGEEYNAGSITSVLAAGIMCGDTIRLNIDGPDEDQAAEALAAYFA